MVTDSRLDVLARRVRWLDRHRRALSLALAVVVWILLSREIAALFSIDWPSVFMGVVTALFGAIAWWIIEMVFGWLMAMWETEHDRITHDRGLPRAALVRRRKK
jgi:hypothetical protein